MNDLNDIQLSPDLINAGAIDWDAPEGGQYPPEVKPGLYTCLFHLPPTKGENPNFPIVVRKAGPNAKNPGAPYAELQFNAEVLSNGNGERVAPIVHEGEPDRQPFLRFQRVGFAVSKFALISQAAELARGLGKKFTNPEEAKAVFAEADGTGTFDCEVGWRAYFDDTQTTVSTHPRKGEVRWPKAADGSYELTATDPQTGTKQFGRAEIMRYKLRKA